MATTVEEAVRQPARSRIFRSRSGDPFGGGIPMALAALAMTGIGFYRTFFSRLGEVDAPHMIHGMVSTGWVVLVLVQASLIKSGRFKYHRVLGWSSVVLFAALMITSWQMIVLMLSPGNPLPFELAKFFAYSDLINVPMLLFLYGGAIYWRKDRHLHSRLISTTILLGIIPAVARAFNLLMPGMDGLLLSMHPTYGFILALLGIAIFADWRANRLRWPFPLVFAWVAMSWATIFPAWQSQWLDALCKWIVATG